MQYSGLCQLFKMPSRFRMVFPATGCVWGQLCQRRAKMCLTMLRRWCLMATFKRRLQHLSGWWVRKKRQECTWLLLLARPRPSQCHHPSTARTPWIILVVLTQNTYRHNTSKYLQVVWGYMYQDSIAVPYLRIVRCIVVICHQRHQHRWRIFFHRERERDHSEHTLPCHPKY